MTTAPRSLRPARRGTAAIEFALAAPVLLLMLSAVISLGAALRATLEVGNAARAGAAYASLHGFDQAAIANAANSATSLSNLTVSASDIASGCTSTGSGIVPAGGAIACPSGAPPGEYVRVGVQTIYALILPVPGMANTLTLAATTVARVR